MKNKLLKLFLLPVLILFGSTVYAQQITVTGTVSDQENNPLPGASIVIKGTTQGTTTDFDGNYTLNNVSLGDIIVASYIGFEDKEVRVGSLSETTKKKVQELAEVLNYKPNFLAQGLRNQESKIVGLIIPRIVHHFFSNIINGVIQAAAKEGYMVITLQSNESYELEKEQINRLIEKNVDGILLSLSDKTVNHKHINQIIEYGIPIVLYDKISKLVNCSKVIIDDRKAACNATQHLIDTGCKKIAHIRGPMTPQTTIDRFLGYKKALELNNIPYDESLVYTSEELSFEDGYHLAKSIVEDHEDVDGVFSFTDLVASGVLICFKEIGLHIPNDIAIMGFSNWLLSRVTSPALSTVDQPGYEMGTKAFLLLYNEIQNNKTEQSSPPEIVEIPTRVIARDSTKSKIVS